MDWTHLVAFGIGMIASVGKDLIQVFIFNRQMKRLGSVDSEAEMDKLMKASEELSKGFGLNQPEEPDKDSGNIESYYKGYYS